VQNQSCPSEELREQWSIQAELLPNLGYGLGGCRTAGQDGSGITGCEPEDEENDDCDADYHRQRRNQPFDQEPQQLDRP
jgi:hypothetical protein